MSGPSAGAVALQLQGPLVLVGFTMNADHEREFRGRGRPMAPPLAMLGLIDTGSDTTIVPRGTFARLGVPITGNRYLRGVGVSHGLVDYYRGRLFFRGSRGEEIAIPVSASESEVGGSVECIIGRDTLLHGRLSYDGRAGVCALTLKGSEIPLVLPRPKGE